MLRSIGRFIAQFSVAGLTRVQALVAAFARAVVRSIRSIAVRAPLATLVSSAKLATAALSKTIAAARSLAKTVAGVGGIAAVGAIAGKVVAVKDAMQSSEEFIATMSKVASTLDVPIDKLSEFTNYAARFGVELEDVRQAFTQFFGVAGEAKVGKNEYYAVFKRVGIDMREARYQTMPMIELLKEFSIALQNLHGSDKTGALTALFGDDDATKVSVLLDALAKSSFGATKAVKDFQTAVGQDQGPVQFWTDAYGAMHAYRGELDETAQAQIRAQQNGSLLSPADVQLQRQYKSGVEDLRQSFRGLQLTIFRTFGPTIIRLMRTLADWIARNRIAIANGLYKAFAMLIVLIDDIRAVFFGAKWNVHNTWLYKLKAVIDSVILVFDALAAAAVLVGTVINDLTKAQTGKSFGKWIGEIDPDRVVKAIQDVATVVADFIYVISGQDGKLQTATGLMMARWRDTVIENVQAVTLVIIAHVVYWAGQLGIAASYLQGVFTAAMTAFGKFSAGIASMDPSASINGWYQFGAAVGVAVDWVRELIVQLFNVFALGQQGTGRFAWINDVITSFQVFWKNVQTAWAWFQELYGAVDRFFKAMHWDLGGTLMFIGFLKLTGILNIVFFVLSLISAFLQGAFIAAVQAGGAAVLAAAATFTGWAAGILALILLVRTFYDLLKNSPINQWFQAITDGLYGVGDAMAKLKKETDASFDKYGAKPGEGPVAISNRSIAAASQPYSGQIPNYITSPLYRQNGPTTNLNLNFGRGNIIKAHTNSSQAEIDAAFRSLNLSPTG